MDLKVRFTLYFSGLFVGLLAVFSWLVYAQVERNVLQTAERALLAHLKHDAEHVGHSHGSIHAKTEAAKDDAVYLRVRQDGKLIEDSFPEGVTSETQGDGKLFKRITFAREGQHYEVVGFINLSSSYAYLRTLRQALLLGCVLSLLALIPFGLFSTKFLLSPFRSLASRTSQLDAEHLSFRFPQPKCRDEYGALVSNFNLLLDRLESSFDQIRRFATNASHELRTPLAVIIGQSDMALRRPRTVDEHREVTQKILAQAKFLRETINRLLLLADIERTETSPTLIPIERTVDDILETLRYVHRSTDVKMTIKGMDSGIQYRGNEVILRTVLGNILENALKYSRGKVTLQLARSAGGLRFCVEDDGPGIPPEAREKVFEPFSRAQGGVASLPSIKGHGLGLSIVKACVGACRGVIHLGTSSLGGLSIEVLLPEST